MQPDLAGCSLISYHICSERLTNRTFGDYWYWISATKWMTRWQVTLYDPIWHEACFQTAIHVYLYHTLNYLPYLPVDQ